MGGIQISINRSDLRRKALCFLFSSLFHIAFGYVLFHYRFTVKLYLDKFQVRNVVIVPPDKLYVPENINNLSSTLPDSDMIGARQIARRGTGPLDRSDLGPSDSLKEEIGPGEFLSSATDTQSLAEPGIPSTISALASGFGLDLPSKDKSSLHGHYRLDLSLGAGEAKNILSGMEKKSQASPLRLSGPSSGKSAVGSSGSHLALARSGAGRTAQSARVSVNIEGYDIAPWAERVIQRVLRNWIIPPTKEMSIRGIVGISVIVERSGRLSSAEVVYSSFNPMLDEVALRAVTASIPFPALPDDFPNAHLEAFFEFHYDD